MVLLDGDAARTAGGLFGLGTPYDVAPTAMPATGPAARADSTERVRRAIADLPE